MSGDTSRQFANVVQKDSQSPTASVNFDTLRRVELAEEHVVHRSSNAGARFIIVIEGTPAGVPSVP